MCCECEVGFQPMSFLERQFKLRTAMLFRDYCHCLDTCRRAYIGQYQSKRLCFLPSCRSIYQQNLFGV